jgi:mono/diheme cytochrome c family protein
MLRRAAVVFSMLGLLALLAAVSCVDYGDKPAASEHVAPSEERPVNPEPGDPTSAARGSVLFARDCARCHGSGAKGDGPEGVNLPSRPRDLTVPRVHNLADGDIFQTISSGRGYMPSWKSRLSEPQIWDLVNYIRTLWPEGG